MNSIIQFKNMKKGKVLLARKDSSDESEGEEKKLDRRSSDRYSKPLLKSLQPKEAVLKGPSAESQRDFKEAITKQLKDLLITLIHTEQDRVSKYILSFDTTQHDEVLLTLTNGLDKLYQLPLTHSYIDLHRHATGIQGSYDAYFTLLRMALDQKSLTLVHTPQREILHREGQQHDGMVMKVHYPLMVGAKVSGTFDIGLYEVKGRERHEIIQGLFIRAVEMLESERARPVAQAPIIAIPGKMQAAQYGAFEEEFQEKLKIKSVGQPQKKRKQVGSLVAPGLKKRKVHGAKFGEGLELDEEDQ